ncbi:UNVERIFIED_CONTAM: hypothetical protein GTU68_058950 [Idotea baltica]|nr:hypothetical protein [Idotea baltica]
MIAAVSASALLLAACATKQRTAEVSDDVVVSATEDTNSAKSGDVGDGRLGNLNRGTVQPVANLGDRVYFDLNGNSLDNDDQAVLAAHAQKFTADPSMRILVAGNCDERGTREYNLALGERRAESVKSYLVSLGIDAGRIDTISYGKERPLAGESNEQAWAMNRNGFIQVVAGQSS